MSEWKKVKLGDCITTKKGFAFKSRLYTQQGVPIVRVSDFTLNSIKDNDLVYYPISEYDKYYDYILSEKDVLIQTVGSWQYNPNSVVGKVVRVPYYHRGSLLNQNIVKIIPNIGIDKDFIYYRIKCVDFSGFVIGEARGAANQASITLDTIKRFTFLLPSLEVQQQIATILSRYDSLIENYQKQIKLLEESAQRLYKEWFVDLRFPGHENVQIVDGVPEGWEKKKVGDLISKVRRTKQVSANNYLNSGYIPVIDQSRNYIAGYTNDIESLVEVTIPYIVFGDHTRVLEYVPFSFAKGADGTQLIMSNDLERMPQSLFYNSLIEIDLSNYSYARHFKYLKEESILVPPKDIAQRYDKVVSQYCQSIQKNREQIRHLTEARDRLLPKLMSGEIEV